MKVSGDGGKYISFFSFLGMGNAMLIHTKKNIGTGSIIMEIGTF